MTLTALSDLLAADRRAHQPIAIKDEEAIHFDRFAADVGGLAARVGALNPRPRRAALFCSGSYAFTVGLFGLLRADCEIVLPPNGQSGTLDSLRDHFELLVDDAFVSSVAPLTTAPMHLDAQRPSIVVFTSGSTGAAKRIVKTLAMFEREITALESLWGGSAGQGPALSTVPHQHIYGLTFKILWPLAAGRPFADQTDELWESLLARITPGAMVVSSPTHLSRLGGLPALPSEKQPSRIFSAGAPLVYEAAVATRDLLGHLPTEIFGSTETGAIATRQQKDAEELWRVLPGIATRQDSDGRLCLRSPWVGEDWFETADIVEPVADGFRFLGRADRIVKIEGKRVSLPEVEEALRGLTWITAAAVTLLPGTPNRLAAAVVVTDEGREKLAELGRFRFGRLLRQALATTQEAAGRPRLWRFVDDLPRPDSMGKRREADIRALFGTRAVTLPDILDLQQPDDRHATVRLSLASHDAVFDGHFPDKPVLPGVAQIDWVMRLAKRCFGLTDAVTDDFQVKFSRIIEPGMELQLSLELDAANHRLFFEYRADGQIMSSGRIRLGPAP